MEEEPFMGRTHQELQVLAFFVRKKLAFDHNPSLPSCRYLPDFIIKGNHNTIIVEVDEDYHKAYDKDLEVKRMLRIGEIYSNNAIFIRVGVDRKKPLVSSELDSIYQKIVSYIDCDESKGIIVDYLFYPQNFINPFTIENDVDVDLKCGPKSIMRYECNKCGYKTNYKHHMDKHHTRKTPCRTQSNNSNTESKLTFDCEFCKKTYTRSDNLFRHKKTCKDAAKSITLTKADLQELIKTMLSVKT